MNINLVLSFIIAGMLLLMLAYMNRGVGNSSQELVISQVKQTQKINIQELITYDFPKIGFDSNDSLTTKIVSGTDSKIVFNSNLDNSADGSIEQVTWEFTTDEVTRTPNENDYILRRTVSGDVTDISLGVTSFKLNYYKGSTLLATPLSSVNRDSLTQVEVILEIQSGEKIANTYKDGSDYLRTFWTKRFTPRNLPNNL